MSKADLAIQECRSCKAPIYWDRTPDGKLCPFNEGTDVSHFTTCPDATKWSKKAQEKKPAKKEDKEHWKEPAKFMRRVGPGHLHLMLDDGTSVDVALAGKGAVLTHATQDGRQAVSMIPPDRFAAWVAGLSWYLTGRDVTSLPAPKVPEEPLPTEEDLPDVPF